MTATTRTYPTNLAEFKAFQESKGPPAAFFAVGLATVAVAGIKDDGSYYRRSKTLDAWYPIVNTGEKSGGTYAVLTEITGYKPTDNLATFVLSRQEIEEVIRLFGHYAEEPSGRHPNIALLRRLAQKMLVDEIYNGIPTYQAPHVAIVTFIRDPQSNPRFTEEAYLRLHVISHRLVQPNGINVDRIFAALPNVVWTNLGAFDPFTFGSLREELVFRGVHVHVYGQDKFPRLVDYVAQPSDVRVANGDMVRLGAHLWPGTTVMNYGFVNYNAGTLEPGPAMVEGRIPQGVYVGANCDIGAGAGIEGTLSGGNNEIITIGENCLLGAMSETGISLGNTCAVQVGAAVHGSMPVWEIVPVKDEDGRTRWLRTGQEFRHASELSGRSNMRFWNANGGLEVWLNYEGEVKLNAVLHGDATPALHSS